MFARTKQPARLFLETLESRQLLSAAADLTVSPAAQVLDYAASTTTTIDGYTPAQIRKAYGFDQVSFNDTTIEADGAGQTIAIVDAFNAPNILADLAVFNEQFDLPDADIKIVNQAGGSKLPATDAGWANEIALDVQWAHAMAPGADILLVEANSDGLSDLLAAVDYARHVEDVSVVSMSWGGSEFFSWGGGEFDSQTDYDSYFTTPEGHQGVTFVAAAGDSGARGGVMWPASSPNVLSVGGTTLNVLDDSGTYGGEANWAGTSSGYSRVESEPDYQRVAQNTGVRSSPDVTYAGDPNTGFAVYNSLAYDGYSGWQVIGGTSAGAPQWAALIALANQGRALAGETTLDGATETLPMLYSLYAATNPDGSSAYTNYFNDVQISAPGGGSPGGGWHWRWGGWGFNGSQATVGFDAVTGLGSPKAGALVRAFIAETSLTNADGGTPDGSGSGATDAPGTSAPVEPMPAPVQLPASPLAGSFVGSMPTSVIGGAGRKLTLKLTNTSHATFAGPVTVTLTASTDRAASDDDATVATLSIPNLKLKAGSSKTVRLKFTYPTGLADDSYTLIASADATGTGTAPAAATSATSVAIAQPSVDLAVSAPPTLADSPGEAGTATVTITNVGNTTAAGAIDLGLFASADGTLDDAAAALIASLGDHHIKLKAGKSIALRIHFVAPADQSPGDYSLVAKVTASDTIADGIASNDSAVIATI